jgi:hypothetical protein
MPRRGWRPRSLIARPDGAQSLPRATRAAAPWPSAAAWPWPSHAASGCAARSLSARPDRAQSLPRATPRRGSVALGLCLAVGHRMPVSRVGTGRDRRSSGRARRGWRASGVSRRAARLSDGARARLASTAATDLGAAGTRARSCGRAAAPKPSERSARLCVRLGAEAVDPARAPATVCAPWLSAVAWPWAIACRVGGGALGR